MQAQAEGEGAWEPPGRPLPAWGGRQAGELPVQSCSGPTFRKTPWLPTALPPLPGRCPGSLTALPPPPGRCPGSLTALSAPSSRKTPWLPTALLVELAAVWGTRCLLTHRETEANVVICPVHLEGSAPDAPQPDALWGLRTVTNLLWLSFSTKRRRHNGFGRPFPGLGCRDPAFAPRFCGRFVHGFGVGQTRVSVLAPSCCVLLGR